MRERRGREYLDSMAPERDKADFAATLLAAHDDVPMLESGQTATPFALDCGGRGELSALILRGPVFLVFVESDCPQHGSRGHAGQHRTGLQRPVRVAGLSGVVATDAFLHQAVDQPSLLATPDYPMIWLPPPVAIVDEDGIGRLAREAALAIVKRLTT